MLGILTMVVSIFTVLLGFFWAFYALIGLLLKFKEISYEQKTLNENVVFSILIPANNEEKVIRNILADIINQTYPNFEVIVICHNCTDRTVDVVSKFNDKRVRGVELHSESGKAIALNYGLKQAKGDIIVVFDADNRIHSDFLERGLKYFPDYDAVQSKIEANNADFSIISKLADLELISFSGMFQKTRHFMGVNVGFGGTGELVKKDILNSVGGWEICLTEDFALFATLTEKHYRIGLAEDMVVYDEKVPFAYDMFKQRVRWIRGHFHVMFKHILGLAKNPLNVHYLISPLGIFGFYFVYFLFMLNFIMPLSIKYLPAFVWYIPFLIFLIGVVVQIIEARGIRKLLFLPLLLLYLYHWIIVLLGAIFIRKWSSSKTEHGFVTYQKVKSDSFRGETSRDDGIKNVLIVLNTLATILSIYLFTRLGFPAVCVVFSVVCGGLIGWILGGAQ